MSTITTSLAVRPLPCRPLPPTAFDRVLAGASRAVEAALAARRQRRLSGRVAYQQALVEQRRLAEAQHLLGLS